MIPTATHSVFQTSSRHGCHHVPITISTKSETPKRIRMIAKADL
jgi:hypothetical protein